MSASDYLGQIRWLHMVRPTGPLVPRTITTRQHQPWLHISTRRVGGLRFIKIGRLCLSFCITSTYRAL